MKKPARNAAIFAVVFSFSIALVGAAAARMVMSAPDVVEHVTEGAAGIAQEGAPSADEIIETPEGAVSDAVEMDGGEEKPFPAPEPAAVSGVAGLTAQQWVLEDIKGAGVVSGLNQHITIATDGKVAGHSGCNRFGGQTELKAGQETSGEITLGALFSTRMACADDVRNQQEAAYLAALAEVTAWRTDGGKLYLIDASGADILRFHAGK